jgi:proton-coupled amino acid transporter
LKQRGGKLVNDSDQDETEYENLDKPGGFRRFHIQQQHLLANEASSNHSNQDNTDSNSDNNNNNEISAFQELFRPDSLCSTDSHAHTDYTGILRIDSMSPSVSESFRTYNPSTVGRTRHFLEYLAITSVMDKFAGENLSDSEDEDTPDEETGLSESTSLLPPNYIGHKKKKKPRAKKATPEHKADIQKTIFLLFKAFIGSGILFLPKAFSNGGLAFSVVIMWLMGGLSLYNFLLLNDCKRFLSGSYGDMGGSLYGPWMRQTVLFSVAISQVCQLCL